MYRVSVLREPGDGVGGGLEVYIRVERVFWVEDRIRIKIALRKFVLNW